MSGRRDDRVTGGQDDRSSISGPPLDGAFLLQLLRRPPQVQPTAPPPAYLPHEVRQPPRDPAVGPTYPFLPHNFFPSPRPPPPSQPPDHYPGALRFSPPPLPDFHQGPRASPGFPPSGIDHRNSHIPGSRPFFRGDPNTSSPSSASDLRSDLGFQPRGGFPADSKPRSFSGNRNLGSRGLDERSMPNGPNPRPGYRKVTAGSVAGVDNELACRMGPGISDAGLSRGPLERNLSHIAGPRRHETFPRSGMNEWRRPPGSQPQSKGSGEWVPPGSQPRSKGSGEWVPPGSQPRSKGAGEWVPPGSQPRSKGSGEWVALKGRGDGGHIMEKGENHVRKVNYGSSPSSQEGDLLWRERLNSHGSDGEVHTTRPLVNHQLDQSGDASGSNLHSIEGSDSEEYLNGLQNEAVEGTVELLKHVKHGGVDGFSSGKDAYKEQDVLADRLMDSLIHKDDSVDMKVIRHSDTRRGKDLRSDSLRGRQMLSQRMRIRRRETECRHDMETLAPRFLSIYESLIPADEEKAKQKQLLLSLVKLVTKEWPNAQLHLYGSCANSFGFSNSDIDICLAINDNNMSKAEILLKLADILQSNNLENVQALTRARVPIVKMMDPVTGISCDICVNNLLAVVNTKLLRDYARIDERLRQLAFIVKHWAKSRGVNETYRGTLSSYAYVIMCIHFLQLRKPAILPCLQGMVATCLVTVDGVECAYFDQVEKLHDFGAGNNESIARLLWGFFHYWAYYHDYTDDVISVRTGRIISKRAKDWTRRIGIDRHLLCIEDPFETSHDLGRVVDKFSIKILREEFERAAYILQYDPNPSVTLFEPYAPGPTLN